MTEEDSKFDPKEGRVTQTANGKILMIGLDRAAKLNGFNPKMLKEIAEAYTELEQNDDYRAGVLYAEGDNFTAGLELDKVADAMGNSARLMPKGCVDPLGLTAPYKTKPVVAAVQGICYTIGIELMLAADIVIAAEGARFSQLEVKRGIMATGGATIRMVERAGWGNAMLHLLTGDEFGPEEALRCNFVQQIVPKGEELNRAVEIAGMIAEQGPLSVRATLANSRTFLTGGFDAAVSDFEAIQTNLFKSNDVKEGVQSFIERRKAKFTGT
jgi:enoyl-CoA hydratase/carnithine racemase